MDFWNQALLNLQKHVSTQCLDTWFRPILFHGVKKGVLHLVVPTESFRRCLLENYSSLLLNVASDIAQIPQDHLSLDITVKSSDFSVSSEPLENVPFTNPDQTVSSLIESGDSVVSPLNPKYTFDTFVVGSSNEFAHAAALAVAEKPSKAYNPLYLYGGAGLGKTHLMHAIGNFILTRNNRVKVCYLSSEPFVNDFVISVRHGEMLKFRNKYRNIDVFLMDDIQFLAKKDMTQVEFFHTFNALYGGFDPRSDGSVACW